MDSARVAFALVMSLSQSSDPVRKEEPSLRCMREVAAKPDEANVSPART